MELKRDDMRERLVTRGPSGEATFDLTSEWPEKPCENLEEKHSGQGEETFGCQRKWNVLGADSRFSALGHRRRMSGVRQAWEPDRTKLPQASSGQGEGVRFYSQRDGNAGWMSCYFVCHLVYSFTKVHPAAGWRRDPRPGTSVDLKWPGLGLAWCWLRPAVDSSGHISVVGSAGLANELEMRWRWGHEGERNQGDFLAWMPG